MPNWCDNILLVEGSEEDVHRWVERAASWDDPDEDTQPIHFSAFLPPPANTDQFDLLDWRVENWGTKWEPEFFDMKRSCGKATYYFETPWGPPLEWVIQVSQQYPEMKFRVDYGEPGMDFSGEMIFQDGQVLHSSEGFYEDFKHKCGS